MSCGSLDWAESDEQPAGSVFPAPWVLQKIGTTSEPELTTRADAMGWGITPDTAQVVPYGTVVYKGTTVCASETAGLTCWNTLNGHGVFMNRDGYVGF